MLFKKTLRKVHDAVDDGSKKIQSLVEKAEEIVDQTEQLVKSSDDGIKMIAGFVVVSMVMQTLVSFTQLRVNVKMLTVLKEYKKK